MTRAARVLWIALLLVLAWSAGCSGCGRSGSDGTSPESRELPAIELRDDTANLLLTWIDERGEHHVVQHPADVPEKGRDAVRVVIAQEGFAGDGDLVYVADLRKKLADGGYAVRSMPRSEWDLIAQQRRDKTMANVASPPVTSGSAAGTATVSPTSRLTVILYGAPWCDACRGATRYLRRKGIDVIEKDIESDQGARAEMQRKLADARIRDRGTIPVIDVRGRILVGFDERELDRAIKAVTKGEEM